MAVKGLFISLTLIFIAFFIISLIFLQQSSITFFSERKFVEIRVNSLINLYNSILLDSMKSFSIIGKRAMNAAINKVIIDGIGLENANETLKELIINGTINGIPQPLMEDSTFNDWKNRIIEIVRNRGFDANITLQNLFIFMNDSFNLAINYSLGIFLTDEKTLSSINRTNSKIVLISIENLEDPIYPLNTFGRVTNYFRKSPHLFFHLNNTTQLTEDLNNSYYHPSLNGASFLDRLEGKYFVQEKYRVSSYNIGLESFVNKEKVLISGLPINTNLTNIDYYYFSNSNITSFKILNMPNYFKLDNETTINGLTHLIFYNATIA